MLTSLHGPLNSPRLPIAGQWPISCVPRTGHAIQHTLYSYLSKREHEQTSGSKGYKSNESFVCVNSYQF